MYKEVNDTIAHLRNLGDVYAAHIATLWQGLLESALVLALAHHSGMTNSPASRKLRQYADAATSDDVDEFLRTVMAEVRRIASSSGLSDPTAILRRLTLGGVSLWAAVDAAKDVVRQDGLDVYIVMDSLEDLHEHLTQLQSALRGLFTFLGDHNDIPGDARLYNVRVCFPAELWGYLSLISANANKDFERHIVLFWHARELLAIAARRLYIYLSAFHEDLLDSRYTRGDFDIDSIDDAKELLLTFFPRAVTNLSGQEEDFFGYVLRHTQLLPRQLIRILNEIMAKNMYEGGDIEHVSTTAIQQGVREAEKFIMAECLAAYSSVYPSAESALKRAIPELHREFSHTDLLEVFRRRRISEAGFNDFDAFREMLLDIGAVGRVTDHTRRYVVGEFSYTLPNKLLVAESDTLCLHPLFSQVYSSLDARPAADSIALPVYPYGSDIEGVDHRPSLNKLTF